MLSHTPSNKAWMHSSVINTLQLKHVPGRVTAVAGKQKLGGSSSSKQAIALRQAVASRVTGRQAEPGRQCRHNSQ